MGPTLKEKISSVKSVCMPENVARVEGAPTRSAHRHTVSLGISDHSIRRTLYKDLHYCPYKIRIVHALKDVDHANRLAFCQQLLNMINENSDLVNNLLMNELISTSRALSISKAFTICQVKTLKDSIKSCSTLPK
jgi:hypothetical protein